MSIGWKVRHGASVGSDIPGQRYSSDQNSQKVLLCMKKRLFKTFTENKKS